jgi:hypothetical protein
LPCLVHESRALYRLVHPDLGLCRVSVPAGGDHLGGAVVPALRTLLSDVEELLAERGIDVDHVTVYRWVQRFTPLLIDAARPCRHFPGDRWFVDEMYVKVAGRWVYLYRAIDQCGQVIDVLVSPKRIWWPPASSSSAPSITVRARPR